MKNDQAESLREQMQKRRRRQTRVLSVVSGKGGVGKSNVSLNVAISLAEAGAEVLLIDMDTGMANLDILLGCAPIPPFQEMFTENKSIFELIQPGPSGVQWVAGGSGLSGIFHMEEEHKQRFYEQLQLLEGAFDFIIFDMGAGLNENHMHLIATTERGILVTTPEPTALMDGYAMMKYIRSHKSDFPFAAVINRVEQKKDGRAAAQKLTSVSERFLGMQLMLLPMVPSDPKVSRAVMEQTPLVIAYPNCGASQSMKQIAATLWVKKREPATDGAPFRQFITGMKQRLFASARM
ncbi:MinD/ParA family protein [Marinococcus halophilus]|uniref:MinD/ParA family protein n=1 Tax=Marinococcus halophilus TaxID=1371 RepID=UPI0009A6CBBA|nr:MinD/ParA family protein [Marinococcus halophilus]